MGRGWEGRAHPKHHSGAWGSKVGGKMNILNTKNKLIFCAQQI
jgi:hypothetical protein